MSEHSQPDPVQAEINFLSDKAPTRWAVPRPNKIPVDFSEYPLGFFDWLILNRHIYRKFKALAFQARRDGLDHWSARAIIQIMRYRMRIRQRGDLNFKINNNVTPGLARLAMAEHAELEGFFTTRRAPGTDDQKQTRSKPA